MLALRLARGARPVVVLRRLMVAAASAGIGFLLLCTLGHAVSHPAQASASLMRLLWCTVPLAAVVQFAVVVARADPASRPEPGLSSVGLGPFRLAMVGAASTAVSCLSGSIAALLVFLYLRGNLGAPPAGGVMRQVLGIGATLPTGAMITLLGAAPVLGAVSAMIALRPRTANAEAAAEQTQPPAERAAATPPTLVPPPAAPPRGLPWGVALVAIGLALEAYAGHGVPPAPESLLPLPGRLEAGSPGVLGGWLLTAVGLIFAGPGLTHAAGRLLSAGRPSALRLLAGRVLQGEAQRIGRPLGVLCAVASGALATSELYGSASAGSGGSPFGPLTGLGAALVMACATATVLTAAVETRSVRGNTTAALQRLGVTTALLRRAVAARAAMLFLVLAPVTWLVAELAAMPLRS